MKKIFILASIWCKNLWDELILKNEIKKLEEEYPKSKFIVSTYDKSDIFYQKNWIKFIEYFPIWIKNPKNFFRNIRNFYHFIRSIIWSDIVVFWGWWIFYDNEIKSQNPLTMWSIRSFFVKLLGKKLHILWVSISINNKKNLKKIKKIFKRASEVLVRDNDSGKILDNLWIQNTVGKDFVFDSWIENKWIIAKEIDAKSCKIKDFEHINFKNKTVWIALRKGFIKNEDDFIKKLVEKILKDSWKVVFIPHSFNKNSIEENDYEFLKNFTWNNINICKNIEESYDIYKAQTIDILIWMRLHSIILGYSYWIKTIAISYAEKTSSIIKTLK